MRYSKHTYTWEYLTRQYFLNTELDVLDVMLNIWYEDFTDEMIEDYYQGELSLREIMHLQSYLDTCYEMAWEKLENNNSH